MILPSIFLWRSRRKDRVSKHKAESTPDDQFAKAELDADESQQPDFRARELPGDMAHELTGNENGDEVWELPGDMAHELTGENRNGIGVGIGIGELSGDMAVLSPPPPPPPPPPPSPRRSRLDVSLFSR